MKKILMNLIIHLVFQKKIRDGSITLAKAKKTQNNNKLDLIEI